MVDGEVVYDEFGRPELKYTGGIRCITTCNGGEVVLSDRSNPSINPELPDEQARKTWLYERFPFSKAVSLPDIVSPWGMSDFDQLKQLQEEIDKTMSQIGLLKDKAARMNVINPKDSGVDNSQITNSVGIINPTSGAVSQYIRYMEPPPIPADLVNALQMYRDYFFLVAGSFELEQAQTPGREVIAYKAIAALIERAATMMRGKIRNYSRMIRDRGRMYLSHVMNWYTEERWFAYSEGGVTVADKLRGIDISVPVQLTVVSGSTMPRSQVQEREEALALFAQGAIDREDLLKHLDWPDRSNVLKRLRQGPLSGFLDVLGKIGAPPELLQFFGEISQMDEKDVKRAIESGEMPAFGEVLAGLLGEKDEQEQAIPQVSPLEEVEVQMAVMEARKVEAEIEQIQAETGSARVTQGLKREEWR